MAKSNAISIVLDLFGKSTRHGRALRLTSAILLGFLCARALHALGISRDLTAIPVAALVASLLMLPRRRH